jgi:hypothetical protein
LSEPLAATTAALEIQRHTGTARDFTAKRGARHELARAGPRYSAIRIGVTDPRSPSRMGVSILADASAWTSDTQSKTASG